MPEKDRRIAENALLRKLVDALKNFIAARDTIWALSFWDRMFRPAKCEQVFASYEQASLAVKEAIKDMSIIKMQPGDSARYQSLISMEEFEALMDRPGGVPVGQEKRKNEKKMRLDRGYEKKFHF